MFGRSVSRWKTSELFRSIVRSPFRAKHHVVMQYMAAGPKCPLPPAPRPPAPRPPPWGQTPPPEARPPPQKTVWLVEDKEDQEELINKEELMTLTPLQCCKGLRTAVALSTASRCDVREVRENNYKIRIQLHRARGDLRISVALISAALITVALILVTFSLSKFLPYYSTSTT